MENTKQTLSKDETLPGGSLDALSVDELIDHGIARHNQGDYEGAISFYEHVLEKDAGNYLAWELQGLALRSMGRYDEALKSFDEAIAIDSNQDYAWKDKGETLYMIGRYQEAVQCFEQALKIRSCADTWNQLAEAYMGMGRQREASYAFSMVQKGIDCD